MLNHPGESFDVTPFVDRRCKTSIPEIQAAVDGAISPEQAIKLRQYLTHIDELEAYRKLIENAILSLAEPFTLTLNLLRTFSSLDKSPMTVIDIFSEIGSNMSVFPTS